MTGTSTATRVGISLPQHAEPPAPWQLKTALVLLVALLQFVNFYLGYKIYAVWQPSHYLDVETVFDRLIPYVKWSWTVYYFGFAYITLWGAAGIWRMPRRPLYRTIAVYAACILVGAALHLVLPTRAPWERVADLTAVQLAFKANCRIEPLACLPSMHVALAVLPAGISCYAFRSRFLRLLSIVLAAAVSLSVVTAREHWFVDAVTGALLGWAAVWWWKRYVWQAVSRARTSEGW